MVDSLRKMFLILVCSCFYLTNMVYASLQEEWGEIVQTPQNISKPLQDCLAEVQTYEDFEEEYYNYACQQSSFNQDFIFNAQTIRGDILEIRNYKKYFEDILSGKETIDSVLYLLLSKRLLNLKIRDEEKKEQDRHNRFFSHTQNALIDKEDPERTKNKLEAGVTFYQFFNSLIVKLYNLTTPDQLSAKTRYQIRLSPALWPLITGESDNLGHPEAAMYRQENDKKENLYDLEFFNLYVDKSERMIMTFNHWQNETRQVEVTPFERSQWDSKWNRYEKIKELPYPSWLNPFKQENVKVTSVVPQEEKRSFTKKEKSSKEGKKVSSSSISLKLKQKDEDSQQDRSVPLSSSANPALIHVDTKNKEIDSIADSKTVSMDPPVTTSKEVPSTLAGLKTNEQAEISTKLVADKSTFSTDSKKQPLITPPAPIQTKQEDILVKNQPRGIRIFHSQRPANAYVTLIEPKQLKNNHLKTLEAIFNHQQFQNVTYSQFISLWRAINGDQSVRESTGSSHKVLLDSKNRVVTGIFSHNSAMTYTRKTIPYIRNALETIGFGESKF